MEDIKKEVSERIDEILNYGRGYVIVKVFTVVKCGKLKTMHEIEWAKKKTREL